MVRRQRQMCIRDRPYLTFTLPLPYLTFTLPLPYLTLPYLTLTTRNTTTRNTTRPISADQAAKWGLVSQVVSAEELMPAAKALAKETASVVNTSRRVKSTVVMSKGKVR